MRLRLFVVAIAAGALAVIQPVWAAPAAAKTSGNCTVTGFSVRDKQGAERIADQLADPARAAQVEGGVRLDDRDEWAVPGGGYVVVLVESTQDMRRGRAEAVAAGFTGELAEGRRNEATRRYVSGPWQLPPAALVRTFGVRAAGDVCSGSITVVSTRHPLTTAVGGGGLGLAIVFGALTVVIARSRRRARSAARTTLRAVACGLLGLLAGLGEAAVLHETGAIGPFSRWIFAVPVAGLAIGVLLALLRRRARVSVPAADVAEVPPGTMVGRYHLQARIGEGSTGTVYRGFDPYTNQVVAIKTLAPKLATDPELITRLTAEAEVMRQLNHPNCVRVFDLVLIPGAISLVSEYVDGVTLRRLLEAHRRLTAEQALGVITGSLRGLGHLHERGLVHRDVKPQNIIVDRGGVSRLIDFGLVSERASTPDSIEGSPGYMSPEQIRGEPLDPRNDVYACGVILAELLTGRHPFGALAVQDMLHAHLTQAPPDLTQLGVSPPLANVLHRAMAKNPNDRFPTADAFLTMLERAAATTYGSDWASRSALGAAVSATLAGAMAVTAGAAATTTALSTTVGAGTGAVAGGGYAGTGAASLAKIGAIAKPVSGALIVAAVAIGAVVVAPEAAKGAVPVITPQEARVVFASTWERMRSGARAPYVTGQAAATVEWDRATRGELPPTTTRPLAVQSVAVPRQTKYPAFFLGIGHVDRTTRDVIAGSFVFVRFQRASANVPWSMVTMAIESEFTSLPRFAIGPDGYARTLDAAARARLIVDPATLPEHWADYINKGLAAGRASDDPLLLPGPFTSGMVTGVLRSLAQARANRVPFGSAVFAPGTTAPDGLLLADGSALLSFSASATLRFSNVAGNPNGGPCVPPNGYVFYNFPGGPFPRGIFRASVEQWSVLANVIVPPKSSASPTPSPTASPGGAPPPPRTGVSILSGTFAAERVSVTRC